MLLRTTTLAGFDREFGEPFGIAVDRDGSVYVSDGDQGKVFRITEGGQTQLVTDKLDTPSAIAFDDSGGLIVADSGTQRVLRLDINTGDVSTIAGLENKRGFADGETSQALFDSPIGLAVSKNGAIFVADAYNDRIRVIKDGRVTTLAGDSRGFVDGIGEHARFDTPCGLAILPDDSLLVADTGNRRLRRVELNGVTTTVAGTGENVQSDGFPLQAKFIEPTAVTVNKYGMIYVADGNSIRSIGGTTVPFVKTITGTMRGFEDSTLKNSKFNRPSGIAFDGKGNLIVADSENRAVRILSGETMGRAFGETEIAKLRYSSEEFRLLQQPRWTYDPPDARRDIAGTLGEIRGDLSDDGEVWFHNGLDIAGSYGETAYFIRSEKVLRPIPNENFGGLRELLRMPTIGYIHLRLGRDKQNSPFEDDRFRFERDNEGKLVNVRIRRGTRFKAGDALGTLNSFNHVHLIAGTTGSELNALNALGFPNISDKIPPTVEKVGLYHEDWSPFETEKSKRRITLSGKIRITVRAFDRMDGNPERRKLGVYRLGYQILDEQQNPVSEPKWTITFEKMPDQAFVKLVYAPGSKSGYTPETVFEYVVTNEVNGDRGMEGFLDLTEYDAGSYILRVLVSDLFGNTTTDDISFEIVK